MSEKDEIMTVKQVADLIGWHPNTVYLRCMSGEIDSFKLGRSRRIYKSDFLKWLKAQDYNNCHINNQNKPNEADCLPTIITTS